ncbi:hypothetical protein [Streptomyces sp. NPDC088910]|uniref:hypothetical protein n=1 Tax=Streptomyces sp. NPDC088910 TaxID=3365911 RepID=UPI00381017AF
MFRPAEVTDFRLVDAQPWTASKAALADQLDLFDNDMSRLEWVPIEFRYRFRCVDDDCPGHHMGLQDWEAGASYRRFLRKYGEQEVLNKLRQRWFDEIFTSDRAVHFFVGNIAAHPQDVHAPGPVLPAATRRGIRPGRPLQLVSRTHGR